MNKKVIDLKQQYVKDPERILNIISNKKKHIEEEKRKLVKNIKMNENQQNNT